MFGKIGSIFFVVAFLFSCANGHECDWEKGYFAESWDYEVGATYRHSNYKATYVIKTTSGREILFRPTQYIVSMAQPGDRIYKERNSEYAFLIDKENDSVRAGFSLFHVIPS